jgi:hypothetical protein
VCAVVEAGGLLEVSAGLPNEECALASGHAWSCAAACAVLGARLNAALATHHPSPSCAPSVALCSRDACQPLWRRLLSSSSSAQRDALPVSPKVEELTWVGASMHNIAVAMNNDDTTRELVSGARHTAHLAPSYHGIPQRHTITQHCSIATTPISAHHRTVHLIVAH